VNNDPVNWVDPWGLYIINNINGPSADIYQKQHPATIGSFLGLGGLILHNDSFDIPKPGFPLPTDNITLPNGLNNTLKTAYSYQSDKNLNTDTTITSRATQLPSGNYAISITVNNSTIRPDGRINFEPPRSGIIAYVGPGEIGIMGTITKPSPGAVSSIANSIINKVNNTGNHDYKVGCTN
jgi:hypothetical protein